MPRKYISENVENREQRSSGLSNKLAFLLVGGGIGAAVALLLAPKSGRELRGDITDATRKGYDKSLETANQLRENSGVYYEQLKEQAATAYTVAADKLRSRSANAETTETAAQLSGSSFEDSELTGVAEENDFREAVAENDFGQTYSKPNNF